MSYKKIKNMTAAILLGCAVLSQSCTSWLDITPEAQVNDKKIFSTPQGFKDVLNGIYITASGEKLYANNLLFGFTDVLAEEGKEYMDTACNELLKLLEEKMNDKSPEN